MSEFKWMRRMRETAYIEIDPAEEACLLAEMAEEDEDARYPIHEGMYTECQLKHREQQ